MHEKTKRFIITFSTTQAAMAAEHLFKETQLPGRLIPVPRQLTAGCGLAWSAPPEASSSLLTALTQASLPWQSHRTLTL